ncbi:MAG: hypothetical protein GYA66_10020 [Phyllobacteriaceae bacterium]|nr:hypothetical protein [Phyllobacteriaceae bacterium]
MNPTQILCAAIAVSLCLAATSGISGDPARAQNVITSVEFGTNGESLGRYSQTEPGKWVELDPSGNPRFEFTEVSRDDLTIGLEDRSRNIALTIDLAGSAIAYGVIGEQQEPLYEILLTSAAATGSGTDVSVAAGDATMVPSRIIFGENGTPGGEYLADGNGNWLERNSAGEAVFSFQEITRSDSGIVLQDKGRNLLLSIDLANRKINFGEIGGAQSFLYDIIEVQLAAQVPAAPGGVETAVASPDGGENPPPVATTSDPALAIAPPPVPSQVKLKHNGWYQGRFTVFWLAPETGEEMSWTSNEQTAPYFEALPFQEGSTSIRIVGEANIRGAWTIILDREIDRPSNKCYVLAGTELMQSGEVSDEPSPSLGDDC